MWRPLLRLLATMLVLLPQGSSVFEWSYRDFSRWMTKGQCAQGGQSPIDIAASDTVEDPVLGSIVWPSGRSMRLATLRANTYTWQVDWPRPTSGSMWSSQDRVTVNGKNFFLTQWHYHSPSENTIDGVYSVMEAQYIHTADDGQLLIVSVMMNIGVEANPYLDWYLWSKFPYRVGTGVTSEVASPYIDFMPKNKSLFHWVGSLTTPPCTTNTLWLLLQRPVNISAAQLTAYRTAINDIPRNQLKIETTFRPEGVQEWDPELGVNIRPSQPLGKRRVTRYTVAQAPPQVQGSLERVGGWLVLLIGVFVGVFGFCVAFILYGCFPSRRDNWGWEVLGTDSRTVSRTNSIQSSLVSERDDDVDDMEEDEEDGLSRYESEYSQERQEEGAE